MQAPALKELMEMWARWHILALTFPVRYWAATAQMFRYPFS